MAPNYLRAFMSPDILVVGDAVLIGSHLVQSSVLHPRNGGIHAANALSGSFRVVPDRADNGQEIGPRLHHWRAIGRGDTANRD